jgi:hypothetical protein
MNRHFVFVCFIALSSTLFADEKKPFKLSQDCSHFAQYELADSVLSHAGALERDLKKVAVWSETIPFCEELNQLQGVTLAFTPLVLNEEVSSGKDSNAQFRTLGTPNLLLNAVKACRSSIEGKKTLSDENKNTIKLALGELKSFAITTRQKISKASPHLNLQGSHTAH